MSLLMISEGDLNSLKVVDFGNAIRCIHEELSLYYDDYELQTLLYRAPEVSYAAADFILYRVFLSIFD